MLSFLVVDLFSLFFLLVDLYLPLLFILELIFIYNVRLYVPFYTNTTELLLFI